MILPLACLLALGVRAVHNRTPGPHSRYIKTYDRFVSDRRDVLKIGDFPPGKVFPREYCPEKRGAVRLKAARFLFFRRADAVGQSLREAAICLRALADPGPLVVPKRTRRVSDWCVKT